MKDKIALSVADAAACLGVSPSMLRGLISQSEVPHIRVGGRVLIPRAALERYVADKLRDAAELAQAGGAQRAEQTLGAGVEAA